jgi:hypothetical protein
MGILASIFEPKNSTVRTLSLEPFAALELLPRSA